MIGLLMARWRRTFARTPPPPVAVERCDGEIVEQLAASRMLGLDPEAAADVLVRLTGSQPTGRELVAAGYEEGRP